MGLNRILTSGNAALSVTTFLGSTIADIPTLEGVPLGTVDGTATGEVAAKVMVVGATALTIAAGNANIGDVDVASIAAGETHIGEVSTPAALIEVTFTTDTAAYASGDVIADTQAIALGARVNDGKVILESVALIDKAKQAAAITVYFFSASTSYGTENSAPSMSAANMAANYLGHLDVATSDWKDAGNASVCIKKGGDCGLTLRPATGTTTIYAAIRNGTGTPTYAADSLVGKFGFLQ